MVFGAQKAQKDSVDVHKQLRAGCATHAISDDLFVHAETLYFGRSTTILV